MGGKGGGGSTGSGAGAPHPQDLPDNGNNSLFLALMQFAQPLMMGGQGRGDFRANLMQQPGFSQMGGGGNDMDLGGLERQFMFMQSLANPEFD